MFTNILLSTLLPRGILWCVLLFFFCFLGVHIARLVRFGFKYKNLQENPQPKPPEKTEEKKSPPPPSGAEPVYYIVERKRKTRSSFSEPKEIRFK